MCALSVFLASSPALAEERPYPFDEEYFLKRSVVGERLLKEAITQRSGDRAVILYNSIFDEVSIASQEIDGGRCLTSLKALVPVILLVYARLAPEQAFQTAAAPPLPERDKQLDDAWTFFREELAACEQSRGRKASTRILPDRLTEAF